MRDSDRKRLGGVMCFWEYQKDGPEPWKLVRAASIDNDGCIMSGRVAPGQRSHFERNDWMNRDVEREDGQVEHIPNMGRAVTLWTFELGVTLCGFHPPERASWLSASFIPNLMADQRWPSQLECGYRLYLGTIEAAKGIVLGVTGVTEFVAEQVAKLPGEAREFDNRYQAAQVEIARGTRRTDGRLV